MTFKIDVKSIREQFPQTTREVILDAIKSYFDDIKSGNVISKPYAKSTKYKRTKHGLPTNSVRLYGSNSYSKKSHRLLTAKYTKWKIKGNNVIVWFKREEDRQLWLIHKKRYKEL